MLYKVVALFEPVDEIIKQDKKAYFPLDNILFSVLFNLRLKGLKGFRTCEPVSTHCSGCPVNVFQNRIHLSAVPPPEESKPCYRKKKKPNEYLISYASYPTIN